jgi:hypothetical protein
MTSSSRIEFGITISLLSQVFIGQVSLLNVNKLEVRLNLQKLVDEKTLLGLSIIRIDGEVVASHCPRVQESVLNLFEGKIYHAPLFVLFSLLHYRFLSSSPEFRPFWFGILLIVSAGSEIVITPTRSTRYSTIRPNKPCLGCN